MTEIEKACYNISNHKEFDAKGVTSMKQHRFWAWGAVICMIMVMITGYKRK
ncbi:MAG TPA: hypothetical protein IAA11_02190 [Candidatus Blautia intestinigallinarum]|nr:hypothetical protein [Candidatus Blautia intestinigallinarum]